MSTSRLIAAFMVLPLTISLFVSSGRTLAQTEEYIIRASVASDGTEAIGKSYFPAISANGRFIAFSSWAINLVSGDTNTCGYHSTEGECPDIFLHDLKTGETSRISIASDGSQGNNDSSSPAISADGRFIAFESNADNLVAGDMNNNCDTNHDGVKENCRDIFLHDRLTGETTRVSVSSAGDQADNMSYGPAISDDGRFVAFTSEATNLVAGDTNMGCDTNFDHNPAENCPDVFIHDRFTGETTRVSVTLDGEQGDHWSNVYDISSDGRYVVFTSDSRNLGGGGMYRCDTDYDGFRRYLLGGLPPRS